MEAEAIGASKAAEVVITAQEILRALRVPVDGPTTILTDNKANYLVASARSTPNRSAHFLRRYHTLLQRVKNLEVKIEHMPDPQMMSDFLTKWVPKTKLKASIAYATNACIANGADWA